MADVTDAAFRRVIAKYGKPDAMWTEFVSGDGLFLGDERAHQLLKKDLEYAESERPIVAQLFTSKPEIMEKSAKLVRELGFDGFDINMGCPDKKIEKQGCGAALIKNPSLAKELVLAAKQGAGDMPVSVKTRIGYNKNELDEWLPSLLEVEPAVITVHARTRKEMSKVAAHWEEVSHAVSLRNESGKETLILGNGDALDIADARKKVEETGCDGVMLGRAIFGNPWLFAERIPTKEERLRVLIEHSKLYNELLPHKPFHIMKKHFKAYVTGWDGAKELRMELMETSNAEEVEKIIEGYLQK